LFVWRPSSVLAGPIEIPANAAARLAAVEGLAGTNAQAILRAMTNFVPVASSSNWLVYFPLTRTLTGCVTNENTGPVGAQGPAGTNGAVGPQGPAGSNGVDGATGPQGPTGTNGVDGINGTNGATGPQGPQGPAGTNGADGAQGPAGTNGAVGPQGPAGSNGVDGATGPQGPAGTNGAVGPQGPQGPAGSNGVSDLSSTQIVTRIVSFSGTDFSSLVGTNNPDNTYQFSWTIATNAGFTGATVSVQSTNTPASWTYWNGATVEPMQTGYLPHTYLNSYSARVYYSWTNSIRGNTYYCRGYLISSNPPAVVNIINKILEAK